MIINCHSKKKNWVCTTFIQHEVMAAAWSAGPETAVCTVGNAELLSKRAEIKSVPQHLPADNLPLSSTLRFFFSSLNE